VNFVNAKVLAGERGIKVSEARAPSDEYINLVTVRAVANGAKHSVLGRFSAASTAVVKIENFRLELRPRVSLSSSTTMTSPAPSAASAHCSQHRVNISQMRVGQQEDGDKT